LGYIKKASVAMGKRPRGEEEAEVFKAVRRLLL
jgi:hypothetical protein